MKSQKNITIFMIIVTLIQNSSSLFAQNDVGFTNINNEHQEAIINNNAEPVTVTIITCAGVLSAITYGAKTFLETKYKIELSSDWKSTTVVSGTCDSKTIKSDISVSSGGTVLDYAVASKGGGWCKGKMKAPNPLNGTYFGTVEDNKVEASADFGSGTETKGPSQSGITAYAEDKDATHASGAIVNVAVMNSVFYESDTFTANFVLQP